MQSEQHYAQLDAASQQIQRDLDAKAAREQGPTVEGIVWVCSACGDWWGSAGAPDLSRSWTGFHGLNGEPTEHLAHTRAQCPKCRARGTMVERTPVQVRIPIPDRAPPEPARPASFYVGS